MEEILKLLAQGKKASITFVVVLSMFLGYQYAEFKLRLKRIEERLSVLESTPGSPAKPQEHAKNDR